MSSSWLLCKPRFSCNDQALLARCPKHLQSVFLNKKLDSEHPYYGQLTAVKIGYLLTVSHDCIMGSSIQVIEVTCFLKLSADQLLVILIDHRLRSKISHCQRNFVLWFRSHPQGFFVNMTSNDLLCADVENYLRCFSLYPFSE